MKFIDLERQKERLKADLDIALNTVLDETNFIGGPEVGMLEEQLKTLVGRRYAISVANGTDALQLSLMSLNVQHGDYVITTSFSFFATAEAISICGANPIFVDIDNTSFNMSAESLTQLLDNWPYERQPKAVIAVDLFGLPADYPQILKVTKRWGIPLIEDGAQSFGASIGTHKAGSFGTLSTTSFFPAKPLGCYGDGGAIFTDDERLAETLLSLKNHGRGFHKYHNVRIGLNSRLDTIQAAILLVKLKIFDSELERKQDIAQQYSSKISRFFDKPVLNPDFRSAWANYTLRVTARDKVRDSLTALGVPTMIYYPTPLHKQPVYSDNKHVTSLENCERAAEEVLSIPIHPYLSGYEIDHIIETINSLELTTDD